MTIPKVTRNFYCTELDDRVVEWSCPCCRKCWLFVAGRKKGQCPWGGSFSGYVQLDEKET